MAYSNTISILIQAKDEASAVLKSTASGVEGVASKLKDVGASLTASGRTLTTNITLPLVAVGTVAVKAAADFQQSMELVRTQAGASQTEVEKLSKSVLELAPKVGQGPNELAKALFFIESSGIRGANAMDVLKLAAEGADVGQANLADTANALTSTMNSQIKGAESATSAMGLLNAIVGAGKMHFQDLNEAISSGFLETAKLFGVSLDSVGAALATLTRVGEPAAQSATRLRMAITLMAAPTNQAAKVLAGIGISADEVKASTEQMTSALAQAHVTTNQLARDMQQPNGFNVAITDLRTHLEQAGVKSEEAAAIIARAFGGGRTSGPIMALVQNASDLNATFGQISQTSGQFSESFAAQQQTASQRFKDVWAGVKVDLIQLGDALLPSVTRAATDLGKAASVLSDWFKGLTQTQKDWVFGTAAVLAVAGPVLLVLGSLAKSVGTIIDVGVGVVKIFKAVGNAVVGLASQFIEFQIAIGPIGWAIEAVILVIAFAVYEIVKHWTTVKNWVEKFWKDNHDFIVAFGLLFFPAITLIAVAADQIVTHWGQIRDFFKHLWDGVQDVTGKVVGYFELMWNSPMAAFKQFLDFLYDGFNRGLSAVSQWGIDFGKIVENAFKSLVRNIPQWGRDAAKAYISGLRTLANYDISQLVRWQTALDGFWQAGLANAKSMVRGVKEGMLQGYRDSIQWGKDLAKGINDGFHQALRDVVQWGRDVMVGIKRGFHQGMSDASQWGRDVINGIVNGLREGIAGIGRFFAGIPKFLEAVVHESGRQVADTHIEGVRSTVTNVDKMKQLGDNILKGIGIAIAAIVAGVVLLAVSIGISIVNGIITGVKDALHFLVDYISRMWNSLTSAFASVTTSIVNWAEQTINDVVRVFEKLPSKIASAVSGAAQSALSSAEKGGSALFNQLGKDLHIPGFAAGTSYAPGGVALVGERGPELVRLPQGSKVLGAGETARSLVGKGVTFNQTNHIYNNVDMTAANREIGWRLAHA